MSRPDRPACAALNEYMVEDGYLYEKLRMNFEWDEHAFQKLVQISTRCLEEIEHDAMIPRYVASFFGYWLHTIMGMMRHPDFLRLNREGRTKEDNDAYFRQRRAIMRKLVRWMACGPRPYPAADYVLPGWPPITETSVNTTPTLIPRAAPAYAPERPACDALHDYMHGDDRRFERPNVNLEWDEEAFQELLHLAAQCLKSTEEDEMIPRHVAELCGDWLQDLSRVLRAPRFLESHRGNRTEGETRAHFHGHIDVISRLISWMSSSRRERPPEPFTPSEWRVLEACEVSTGEVGDERDRAPSPESLHTEATQSKPERPACTALRESMVRDNQLLKAIRTDYEWDERGFQRLVQICVRCLEEIEHDVEIPRHVATFCGGWLHIVMEKVQHPSFRMFNSQHRTRQEAAAYFDDRVEIMRKLVHWMSSGPRPYPVEDFILPGWQLPITDTVSTAPASTLALPATRASPEHDPKRCDCAALDDYMRGRGRQFEAPSADLVWDDDAFRALVPLVTKCLEEYAIEDLIPRHVARLVGDWLQDLRRTLRAPRFIALNRGDRAEEQALTYFFDRIYIIERLVSWMATGKRLQSLEHFVPSK